MLRNFELEKQVYNEKFEKFIKQNEEYDKTIKDNEKRIEIYTKMNGEKENENSKIRVKIKELETTLADMQKPKVKQQLQPRKDPVVVKTGDIVTYRMTIYNEGEQKGYATKIVDQLPAGLTLTDDIIEKLNKNEAVKVTGTKGTIYTLGYNKEKNEVTFTIADGDRASAKELKAYNDNTIDSEVKIDSETIEIRCKVNTVADDTKNTILTNIAYIAEEYNSEAGVTVDRDSVPGNTTIPENLVTENLGYTGKDTYTTADQLNDIDKYYKGQEDDDDF